MASRESLRQLLRNIDNRGYKAYKEIQGRYQFPELTLIIDWVQADPFAAPSHLLIQLPHAIAGFPPQLYQTRSRQVALRDRLTREFDMVARKISERRGTGNSGLISIAKTGQEVIDRTSVLITDKFVEVRFFVGLPASGRRILGYRAAQMLCDDLPEIVDSSLKYGNLNPKAIGRHVETAEDADWLRSQLTSRGLVAFVADGAILPRRSGVDPRPLAADAISFKSPDSLRVKFNCPNRGTITGMGIPVGITLIVGGGYHGKSTLLRAIELGVYNHVPGDGREFVVTNSAAVKIRAEDGRSVAGVDISPFINHLPQSRQTTNFSTTNASGSTSQAANIIEALEAGAGVLLVDEDTAATNFMIRDRRMQALIAKDKEPITPFIDKVGQLSRDAGVSTIMVMGGSGDYFDVADTAIAMDNFQPQEVTAQAKAIAREYATSRTAEGGKSFGKITARVPLSESLDPSRGNKSVKLKVRDVDGVVFGNENIDLSAVEQIVEVGQLQAIAEAIVYAKEKYLDGKHTVAQMLDGTIADISKGGLDVLTRFPQGDLAEFRSFELAAAINRLRTLEVKS
ncbi:MAG: ABC-ATPase domain-containing protein [Hormoscilla sp. SP5CHS1]|nr:ABC-ATPase domain-containing protein [Hormoscilla sp. SP5CHS1]